jgi:hypothetical protein
MELRLTSYFRCEYIGELEEMIEECNIVRPRKGKYTYLIDQFYGYQIMFPTHQMLLRDLINGRELQKIADGS